MPNIVTLKSGDPRRQEGSDCYEVSDCYLVEAAADLEREIVEALGRAANFGLSYAQTLGAIEAAKCKHLTLRASGAFPDVCEISNPNPKEAE